jgi:hypothetical protein
MEDMTEPQLEHFLACVSQEIGTIEEALSNPKMARSRLDGLRLRRDAINAELRRRQAAQSEQTS